MRIAWVPRVLGFLAMATVLTSPMLGLVTAAAHAATDPVVAIGGDVACDPADVDFNGGLGQNWRCQQLATTKLLVSRPFDAVLSIGDNQCADGSLPAFLTAYDPKWGRVKAITRPVPGNHEYRTPNAAGFFQYFGAAAGDPSLGYYSCDIGRWHAVALNSKLRRHQRRLRRWLSSGAVARRRPGRACQSVHPGATTVGARIRQRDLDNDGAAKSTLRG